jgi:hypothetical protein
MAMTLAQAATLSTDMLQKGVQEVFVQTSPILDRLPLMSIEGNAYAYNEEGSLPGVAFRGVNEAYVESTGTFNQRTEGLSILGGDADVDKFIQITRANVNDQRAEQTKLKVKAASYKFQDTFFNGDVAVDAKSFDGMKKRLTGAQVIDTGTDGAPVLGNGGTDAHAFFDALDALVAQVQGLDGSNGAIYANFAVRAKIQSAGRRIGGVEMVREDLTGKRVLQWNGIPVLDPGANAAGTQILPASETQGTASTATSVYAVRFGTSEGDHAVTGLTNGGVQVYDLGELQEKPALRTRIEFYVGVAVFGGKAAARLRGVLAA